MKTMNASEFAKYIFNRFPEAINVTNYGTSFHVMKAGCYEIISVWEPKSGMTKININGQSYTKMNAAEKREAVNFIDNFEFDIVYDHDVMIDKTEKFNYVTGTFYEGQEITVVGSNTLWRRIEKIVHVK